MEDSVPDSDRKKYIYMPLCPCFSSLYRCRYTHHSYPTGCQDQTDLNFLKTLVTWNLKFWPFRTRLIVLKQCDFVRFVLSVGPSDRGLRHETSRKIHIYFLSSPRQSEPKLSFMTVNDHRYWNWLSQYKKFEIKVLETLFLLLREISKQYPQNTVICTFHESYHGRCMSKGSFTLNNHNYTPFPVVCLNFRLLLLIVVLSLFYTLRRAYKKFLNRSWQIVSCQTENHSGLIVT